MSIIRQSEPDKGRLSSTHIKLGELSLDLFSPKQSKT